MCASCNVDPSTLMKVDADGQVWISQEGIKVYKQAVALQGLVSMDLVTMRAADQAVKVLDVLANLLPDMYVDLTSNL